MLEVGTKAQAFRTIYLIDEEGIIIRVNDKIKAADEPEKMRG